ncbi:hypothetical protein B0T14DRAFT_567810 [Immersiella caudata]|uniref:Uncharacterized protein n=1 Tax=Immersiella caudata TaxID=314043 RepID=A0AA39WIT7_9PEZI|nr:hypothetical protein B0T14DRAFT_567810 [Immersiella caudata]
MASSSTAALPEECWVNIFEQISEKENEVSCNVFHVAHPASGLDEDDEDGNPPDRSTLQNFIPARASEALWRMPAKHHGAITQVNRGLRKAALTHGAFIFGPGGEANPNTPGGVYFRWDHDILWLDWTFWAQHFDYEDECHEKWMDDQDTWDDNLERWGVGSLISPRFPHPKPRWANYSPAVLPALLKSHKNKIQHIGLPHQLVWAQLGFRRMFEAVYKNFPNVEYFWIYEHNWAKRPRGVDNDVYLTVDKLSVGEKHHLNIRKYHEQVENTTNGQISNGREIKARALKHANHLRRKSWWKRNPDVAPRAVRFRRITLYRPFYYPDGEERVETPRYVETMHIWDADSALDADSSFFEASEEDDAVDDAEMDDV